nr:site-specific DNA-methyltransferase [uncultured Desulfobacter sp.]
MGISRRLTGRTQKGYTFEEHLDNIKAVMEECARVTVPGGVIALNVDDIHNFKGKRGNDKYPHVKLMIHKYQTYLKRHGVFLEDKIVWVKDQTPHSKDMSKAFSADTVHSTYRHIKRHDFVYIFRKKGERVAPSEEASFASALTKEEWSRYIPSIWTIPAVRKNDGHPTVFPDELARRIIKMYSFVGETVLDPFLGSGTTIKVARELEREGLGYERAEELYRDVIATKLEGTLPNEDSEPKETLTEHSKRILDDLEANQPEEPKATVIMSEGMKEAAEEILAKHAQALEHA